MRKAIIFGCGKIGTVCYYKIKESYQEIVYTDNNEQLWGTSKKNISILSPEEIFNKWGVEDTDVYIAIENASISDVLIEQVKQYGEYCIYVYKLPFFYSNNDLIQIKKNSIGIKTSRKSVLFVSAITGIRDNKIASIVKKMGWDVYLVFLELPPAERMDEYTSIYSEIISVESIDDLVKLVEESDFDIIHCSSEPEFVTALLKNTGKIVIHDCHDLNSLTRANMTPDSMTIEYLSHSMADGVIYPSEKLRCIAVDRFNLNRERTLVIEGLVTKDMIPNRRLPKKSLVDGEIHAVYEGLIVNKPKTSKKYVEDMWIKIAKAGVHVHFYSQFDVTYCNYLESLDDNIHYEGNCSSKELSVLLSQYDVGLVLFNDNSLTHLNLECASPLKLYEYLNAGIPVAISNIENHKKIVEHYGVGKYLDLNGDIYMQLKNISRFVVDENFLVDNKLILDEKGSEIINFYEKLIEQKRKGIL